MRIQRGLVFDSKSVRIITRLCVGGHQLKKTQLLRRLDVKALNDYGYNNDKWNRNGKPANSGGSEACDTNDIDKLYTH